MFAPVFKRPRGCCLGDGEISNVCWRIKTFVERDAYALYDYKGSYALDSTDVITEHHLYVTNSAMRARSSRKAWAPFIGTPLPEMEAIPPELDLITANDNEFHDAIKSLSQLSDRLSSAPGITEMAISKVLYLLRPRFIAIADSYVRDMLGMRRTQSASTNLRLVMEAVREWGQCEQAALEEALAFSKSIGAVTPTHGKLRGTPVPVQLSRIRILDIILWTELALCGPTRHRQWSQWFDREVLSTPADSNTHWQVWDYETDMLKALLPRRGDAALSLHLRNAVVESLLLHIRNLCDIVLTSNTRDDISLETLIPEYSSELVNDLRTAYGKANSTGSPRWTLNKMFAHPTTYRSDTFNYAEVVQRIGTCLIQIINEVEALRPSPASPPASR